jgi:hypothetical protein
MVGLRRAEIDRLNGQTLIGRSKSYTLVLPSISRLKARDRLVMLTWIQN